MRRRFFIVLGTLLIGGVMSSASALAASPSETPSATSATPAPSATSATYPQGSPDPSFGTRGSMTEGTSNSFAGQIYRQANGQIVFPTELNGQATLIRMNGNGTLDSSFGNKGVDTVFINRIPPSSADSAPATETRVAAGYSGLTVVTQASNGTYYAGGYSDTTSQGGPNPVTDGVVVHLLSNGALDPTFGTDGVVTFRDWQLPGSSGAHCTELPTSLAPFDASGGGVIAAVAASKDCSLNAFGGIAPIQKFGSSGRPDSSFAAQIKAHLAHYGPTIVMAFPGEIITNACPNYPVGTVALTAVGLNGILDRTWGKGGCSPALTPGWSTRRVKARTQPPQLKSIVSLSLQPNNSIVVAVNASANSVETSWLARLTAKGQIDRSFGTGTPTMSPTPLNGTAHPWVQGESVSAASGRIVLLSQADYFARDTSPGEVASVLPNGTTDKKFGHHGVIDLALHLDTSGIEVQPDYRVVVSGTVGSSQCAAGPNYPDSVDAGNGAAAPPCQAELFGYTDHNL